MNTTALLSNLTSMTSKIDINNHDTSYVEDVMAMAKKMHWVTSSICGTIFLTLGLIGNFLSICIWRKKSMMSSTGSYLIAQAINDIGLLIFFFLTDSLVVLIPSLKSSYWYGVFHSYIGYPIFYFFIVNSIWTLVGVTVDRYIQVCWIDQAKDFCNNKRAKLGIFLISVLSFMINAPHFNTYYPIPSSDRKPEDPAFDFTEFGLGNASQMYEFWVHCMFIVLVPWVTIVVMNVAIIRRLRQVNKQMNENRGEKAKIHAQQRENQVTNILLTVTFTFLLLVALQCITQCFFMMKPAFSNHRIVEEAWGIAKIGLVVNSSINFLLYCVSGKRFRVELRRIITNVFRSFCTYSTFETSALYTMSSEKDHSTVSSNTACEHLQVTIATDILRQ